MRKLSTLLLFLLALPAFAEKPRLNWTETFEGESPTAVLRVKYRSTGCFQGFEYEIDFNFSERGLVKATVTRLRNLEKAQRDTFGVKIGTVTLSGRDLDRFTGLLDYYQAFAPSDQQMSTVDHLVFQKVDNGKVSNLAEIEDFSGRLTGHLEILTFAEIIDRAERTFATLPAASIPRSD